MGELKNRERITLSIPIELNARLDRHSKQTMAPRTRIAERAIEEYLNKVERRKEDIMKNEILKQIEEIEKKALEDEINNEIDDEGNHPVWRWALIEQDRGDEFVTICKNSEEAIRWFQKGQTCGYISCNLDENGKIEPWFCKKDSMDCHSAYNCIDEEL